MNTKGFAMPSIRLLTYNMFLRPPGISDRGGDWKSERVADFGKYASDFDVICFQEAFSTMSTHLKALRRVCRDAGLKHYAWPTSPKTFMGGSLVDSGLFIVSRYPLTAVAFVPFGRSAGPDALAYKGAQVVAVHVDDGGDEEKAKPLLLVNTHLQASYLADETDNADTRASQLRQLVDVVHSYPSHVPAVVVGDFNIERVDLPGFDARDRVKGKSMRRFYHEGRTVSRASAPADCPSRTVKIDHLLGRHVTVEDAKLHPFPSDTELGACSDHKGLSATIEF